MAIRNLRKRKLRSWLTLIGIVIGITAIVSLIGLGQGLQKAVMNQFGAFAPDLISVQSGGQGMPGTGEAEGFTDNDVEMVGSLKGIKESAGRYIKFSKIEFNNKVEFTAISSMPSGKSRDLIEYAINMKALKGRTLKDGDKGKAFVGINLVDKDKFGKEIRVGSKIKINGKDFDVVGIMKKTGTFFLDQSVFINQKDFEELFNVNKYSFIVARYDDNYDLNEIKENLERLMRRLRGVKKGNEDFRVTTPQNVIDNIKSTLFAVQLFFYIIAGISIVVGGIGIMTTMYTSVVERTKEIGIMKAIGARNETIFTIFLIEAGAIGMIGGVLGVIFGSGIAFGLVKIAAIFMGEGVIIADISPILVISSLLFSFLLGSVFGTFPAMRASKMKPVDALTK